MNRWEEQTWEMFEEAAKRKKVFLFGAGANMDVYFARYREKTVLDGVIDNNCQKQGFCAGEFASEAWGLKQGEIKISDISILKEYSADEVIVLITSKQYYGPIARQLEEACVDNYFVLVFLEMNQQKELSVTKSQDKDNIAAKKAFADECCKEYPINRKKIFFRAYGDYTDHGKYITEALIKIRRDLDIVWVVNDWSLQVPEGVRKIYGGNWKRLVYEIETARVWVFDLSMFDYIIKRNSQIYIQTKHWASITLKKFYLDAVTFQTEPKLLALWKRDSEMIDYIITGSDFDTVSCRRGFDYQGEVLQIGSPRSDAMFWEKQNKKKVYDYYGIDSRKHTVLYAPTYRFDKTEGKRKHESRNIELDYNLLKDTLEQRFGGEWRILLRLHPSVASTSKNIKKEEYVIDASTYHDSQELVSASDITISDFSSIMFEPAFVKKPVFLFVTDLQDYLTNEYDLLIEYSELPFPKAESNQELRKCILNFDEKKYEQELTAFLERYGVHEDGHASGRAAEFISGLMPVEG